MGAIEFLSEFLHFLSVSLRQLEVDKNPTSNLIYPVVTSLQSKWNSLKEKHPKFNDVINYSITQLEERFPLDLESPTTINLLCCTLMDPRFSNFDFIGVEKREIALQKCVTRLNECLGKEDTKKTTEVDNFIFIEEETAHNNEVEHYLTLKARKTSSFDLLSWWKYQETMFPQLSQVARMFLSIPASSATSERVFSKSNLILSNLRSRLTSNVAKQLTFIAVNNTMEKENLDWNYEILN